MVMNAVKTVLLVILILAIITFMAYLIATSPSYLERRAGYREVLQIELPKGVTCVNQALNESGRERRIYDYRLLLQGDVDLLLAYIAQLWLREENLSSYTGANYFRKGHLKWWDPPSLTKMKYRFYQKDEGRKSEGHMYTCLTQVELTSDKLYLVKFEDIKALEKRLKVKREKP